LLFIQVDFELKLGWTLEARSRITSAVAVAAATATTCDRAADHSGATTARRLVVVMVVMMVVAVVVAVVVAAAAHRGRELLRELKDWFGEHFRFVFDQSSVRVSQRDS
jgi:threonine/homoserine/homoserine lactone efflux protein